MRIKALEIFGVVFVLVTIMISSFVAYSQEPTEPDYGLGSEDISFTPSSPVRQGDTVWITANIHNYGLCYVVLGDTADYVGYDITQPTSFNNISMAIRWRGTASFTASVRVSIIYDSTTDIIGDFNLTILTAWRIDSAARDYVIARPAGNYTVRVAFLVGGLAGDVHLDWVQVDMGTNTHFFEAEEYNTAADHSDRVNAIVPSDVVTQFFFDASKIGAKTQIGENQTVGSKENYVHDLGRTVKFIENNGVATALVVWNPPHPIGTHNIWVRVDSAGNGNTANNEAYKEIVVQGPVGGIDIELNTLVLLAPYVGLASTTIIAAAASAIYFRGIRRRK